MHVAKSNYANVQQLKCEKISQKVLEIWSNSAYLLSRHESVKQLLASHKQIHV